MSSPPYDPRAVANLLLDLAADECLPITNLALQKLLYFAHALFLIQEKQPLVQGAFEAWTHGPVHPAAYRAFKSEGNKPIGIRACGQNVITGESRALDLPDSLNVRRLLRKVVTSYGHISPGRLVEISHAPNGPWGVVVRQARTGVMTLGMRIPDGVIREHFQHHKVMLAPDGRTEEPYEDTPLVGD